MKHLLVPIDFSEVSAAVLEHAASMAGAHGAKITLIHVSAPDPEFVGMRAGPDAVRDVRAKELRHEHRDLQQSADELRERGLDAKALMIQGPTVETILEEAEKLGCDTIVIGSHGHGAIHRVMLGSISEGVVRGAKCPVLIVPSAKD
jgi:nucleotide-binding universal stress UspA family protein